MANENQLPADTPPPTAAIAQTREQSRPIEDDLLPRCSGAWRGADFTTIGVALFRSMQELSLAGGGLETPSIARCVFQISINTASRLEGAEAAVRGPMSRLSLDPSARS